MKIHKNLVLTVSSSERTLERNAVIADDLHLEHEIEIRDENELQANMMHLGSKRRCFCLFSLLCDYIC